MTPKNIEIVIAYLKGKVADYQFEFDFWTSQLHSCPFPAMTEYVINKVKEAEKNIRHNASVITELQEMIRQLTIDKHKKTKHGKANI